MNKQESKTEKLDKLGRSLLESARIKNEEIEKIIAAPQLFSLVKARIEDQRSAQTTGSSFFLFLNWPRLGFSFGALTILLVGLLSLSFFDGYSSLELDSAKQNVQEIQLSDSSAESRPVVPETIESQVLVQSISFIREPVKSTKPALRSKKQRSSKPVEEEAEFYPLTFAGEDFREDAQIVRVELPRSSLIALGITLPAEKVTEKIKTELLIGSDGITRGIRLVN